MSPEVWHFFHTKEEEFISQTNFLTLFLELLRTQQQANNIYCTNTIKCHEIDLEEIKFQAELAEYFCHWCVDAGLRFAATSTFFQQSCFNFSNIFLTVLGSSPSFSQTLLGLPAAHSLTTDFLFLPFHIFIRFSSSFLLCFHCAACKRSVLTIPVLHSWVTTIDQTQLIPSLPSSQPLTLSTEFSQHSLLRLQHSVGPSCVEASLSASPPLPWQPHKPQASLGAKHVGICCVYTEREQCGD